MSITTINVTQSHTLGVEEAIARLSQGGLSYGWLTKLSDVTVRFTLEVPGFSIPGRVVIAADKVTVDTEPSLVSIPFDWLTENRIKAKLEELLK